MRQLLARTVLVICCLAATVTHASFVTFSGSLNDPGNTALKYFDLTAALFGNDFEIANNVAIHALSVPVAGTVTIDSNGFAAGGVDPYYTLFQGSGNGSTFLDSNFAEAFSIGGDFLHPLTLAAGDYVVAIGAFANMSFAENGAGTTLGDGFIGLGGPGALGNYYYELIVTLPDAPGPRVPEPSTMLLIGGSLLALGARRRRSTV